MNQNLHRKIKSAPQIMNYFSTSYSNVTNYRWAASLAVFFCFLLNLQAFNPEKGFPKDVLPKTRTLTTHTGFSMKQFSNAKAYLPFVAGADIGLAKSASKTTAAVGEQVTYTLKVYNEGTSSANDVVIKDVIPAGTSYVSSLPAGWYNSTTEKWMAGNIAAGDSLTFTLTVKIETDGVAISEAEVFSMTGADMDSTPDNGNPSEDDWASTCTSIPMYYCSVSQIEIEVEAPAGFNSYKWYKNGNLIDTNRVYTITDFGDYHYEANLGGVSNCPVELCCPIQVKQKCLALGNLVWADTNNNGIKENTENGIENIEVVLYSTGTDSLKNGNDIAIDTVLTDADGLYNFGSLAEGTYYVKLQDVPASYSSSTGQGIYDNDHTGPYENGPDPDNNLNNVDDGTEMVGTGMIMSGIVSLDYESEPINDDDTNANTNTTIDFGLYEPVVFDLALTKIVTVGQPSTYNLGDQVTFTISVLNQGSAKAYDVEVSDYIPTGLTLNDPNWTESNGIATFLLDSVDVASTQELDITFTIDAGFTGTSIINNAEISKADDDQNPNNTYPTDIDSTPDNNPSNDGTPKNDVTNEDGKNGGDEDDHDPAAILINQPNPTLSLGNLVWNDTDNDGKKDANEEGIEGVEVILYDAGTDGKDSTDVAVDIAFTDVNGNYLFTGLEEGIYYVKLTGTGVPFGMVSSNGNGTPYVAGNGAYEPGQGGVNEEDNGTQMGVMIMSDTLHLLVGKEPTNDGDADPNTNLTVDFGLHKPIAPALSLGNLVWNDTDNDGIKDANEDGIENIQVVLYDAGTDGKGANDVALDTLLTAANGNYLFTGLTEGIYYVKLTGAGIPAGMVSSNGNGTPYVAGNGTYEPGQGGVNEEDNGTQMGVMIMSDTLHLLVGKEPTDDGDTNPNTNLTVDFGLHLPELPTLSLGNLVWNDTDNDGKKDANENGIEGVEVILYDAGTNGKDSTDVAIDIAFTDVNGNYLFTGLEEGIYYVKLTGTGIPSGMVSSNGNGTPYVAGNGAYEPGQGGVNNEDNGTQMGVMIMSDTLHLLVGKEPTNDGDTDPNTNLTVDFGLHKPIAPALSLGNLVWNDANNDGIKDANEDGIQNIQVVLYDAGTDGKGANDVALDTLLTDANGNYLFTGLTEGIYYVKLTGAGIPAGMVSSNGNGTPYVVGNGAYEPGQGGVNNEDNGTQMGVMIMSDTLHLLVGKEPTNDGDTNPNTNLTVDFGLHLPENPTLSLGNLVWNDTDNDGIKDTNENGIEGVEVILYDAGTDGKDSTDVAIDIAFTDVNGNYLFTGLEEGIYYVKLTGTGIPAGMVSSNGNGTPYVAGNGAYEPGQGGVNNEDNGTQMGVMIMSDTLHLLVGKEPTNDGDTNPNTNLTVDFGLHLPIAPVELSIGNLVWNDQDNNGYADSGEPGLENVTVILYDAGNNGKDGTDIPVDTTLTDANGHYLFSGLPEGNYYVKLTGDGIPQGWYSSTGDGTEDYDQDGLYEPGITSDTSNNYDNGTQMGAMVMSDIVELTEGAEPTDDDDTDPNTNLTIDFGFFRPDTFDLALNKRLADGQTPIVSPGDTLVYTLEVTNTGNIDAEEVVVVDYLPNSLQLADPNWAEINGVMILINPIPFIPVGGTASVDIITTIDPNFKGGSIVNFATVDVPIDSFPDNDTDTVVIIVRDNLLSLGDLVWNDLDNDGQKDPSENGIAGVTLQLYNAGSNGKDATDTLKATTTTDIDGFYLFTNLQAGHYYVKISGGVPLGMISSTGNGATDPGSPGNYEPSNLTDANNQDNGTQMGTMIMSNIVVLEYDNEPLNDGDNDATTNLTVDFGLYKPVELPSGLSGTAFVDCNNDGVSTGDSPLANVTVTLTGGASPVVTTTNVNGMYSFGALTAGSYKLTFSKPTGLGFTTLNQGTNDNIDNDVDPATGMTANFTLTAGQNAVYDAGYNDPFAPTFVSVSTVQDITVECDEVPTAATLSATDTYDLSVSITYNEVKTVGTCSENYILRRTWTASDDCGNQTQHIQTITVRDTEAPVFATSPVIADVTVTCNQVPDIITGITATDNCDKDVAIAFKQDKLDGSCADSYVLVRTWTASDDCGNVIPKVQKITVQDILPPVFTTSVQDATVACGQIPSLPIMNATDNCDNDVRIFLQESALPSTCADSYIITRTWTAEDNCGNKSTLTSTITVIDNEAPKFGDVPASVTINCGQSVNAVPTVTDNCDKNVQVTVKESAVTGDCATGRTATREYTATDNCGNTATFVQTIYVIDNESPTLSGTPANVTVTCKELPPPTKVNVSDNCAGTVMIMFDEKKTAGDNCTGYIITRTWTAMDACGNTASYVQTITVEGDKVAPVITGIPADADYDCVDTVPTPTTASVSDDCDNNPKLTFTEDKLGDGCGYKLVRIWTATDNCGNKSTKEQIITVRDKSAPIITGLPADLTVDCADALPTPGTPIATDACDNSVTLTYGETTVGDKNSCEYKVIRTWTATDKCGNSTSAAQTITVRDTKAPTITPNHPMLAGVTNGGTITIECEKDLIIMDADDATATDNCDKNPTITFDEYEGKKGDCITDGYSFTIICRWTATDKCGNSSTFTFKVIVKDTKAPIFSNVPANTTLSCGDNVPAPVVPSVTDNCDNSVDIAYNEITSNGNCPGASVITRTWTATDDCGNKAVTTQIITIEDKTAPVISNVPVGQTVACGQTPPATQKPTATDACDKDVTMVYADANSSNGGCLGSIVRTWTATDDCGNIATATQVIVIEDKEAPKLVGVPADSNESCDYNGTAPTVTATDNCDTDVKVVFKEDKIGAGCQYKIIRTWTATDKCGNSVEAAQTINIRDTKAPILAAPGDVTIDCKDLATVPQNATATDDCDKDVAITHTDTKIGVSCNYTIRRTYTATDDCGNTATKVQNIAVFDTTPPLITFKDPILQAAHSGDTLVFNCDKLPAYNEDTADATDDCSGVKLTKNDKRLDFFDKLLRHGECDKYGYTDLLYCAWEATDSCGNKATWFMYVKVVDKVAPVLVGVPNDLTLNCDATKPSVPTVTATDNCSTNVIIKYDETPYTGTGCVLAGSVVRTWTAIDSCGNATSKSQRIIFTDTEKPTLIGVPGDLTLNCGTTVPSPATVKAADNCSANVSVVFAEAPYTGTGCVANGSVIRTWTATDDCGNVKTGTQRIIISDTEKPVLAGVPSDLTLNCGDNIPTTPNVTATDNCSSDIKVAFASTDYTGQGCVLAGSVIRTWTATDDCGNVVSASQRIVFTDTEKPQILGVPTADITLNENDADPVITITATDNCDKDVTLKSTATKTTNTCDETTTYTVMATDDCGNFADATYKIIRKKSTDLVANIDVLTKEDSCNTKNGSATLSPSNYVYTWADGFVGASRNNLAAGDYIITVSDGVCAKKVITVKIGADCPPVCVKPAIESSNITETGCGTGSGSIIFTMKDGDTQDYTYVWSTPNGNQNIANNLEEGSYSVTVTRKADATCFDIFKFTVVKKGDIDVFNDDALTIDITDCQNGKALICANLTPSDINNGTYSFTVNGAPYLGTYKGCQFDTTFFYNPKLTVGQNPFELTGWSINGKVFTGEFNTVAELVTLMNSIDKNGDWKLAGTGSITGGNKSNFYGKMDIRSKNTPSSTSVVDLESKLTPYSMGLQLGVGNFIIEAKSNDGCIDVIKVKVTCTPPPPNCKSFIDWEVENVFTTCGTPAKLCLPELPFANIADINITDNGAAYTGGTASCTNGGTEFTLTSGVHQMIFIKKDGCRDTLVVKVACTTARIIKDTVYVAQKDTICLDVAELLGNIKDIQNIWPLKSGEHARFELIPGTRCITCLGIEAGGTDEAAYVIADDQGVHDTTYFQISVIERVQAVPTPEAIADDATIKEGEVMVLDVLANDKLGGAKLSEIKIVEQPKNGFVFINQENKVVFTPKPGFCDDTNDEFFSYKICTIGGCDDAPVTIKVLCNDIKVYTGFSPNGDGTNDTFVIEGTLANPDNKLSIFNRYGNQVYFKENYRNDWGGTWNGKNLPDGTYFYLYEDGKGNKKAGYVQIQR